MGRYELVPCFFRSQNIVNVENVIAIFVVVSIVLRSFAGLGEDAAGVARGFVFEIGIANTVGRR